MTQEDKDLLLKDLCGRIPYGVRMLELDPINNIELELYLNNVSLEGSCCVNTKDDGIICSSIDAFKPYLFPISSITEEQKKEAPFESSLLNAFINGHISLFKDEELTVDDIVRMLDWLNKNHFDYRGLIPKGLAIDATRLNIY